MKRLNWLTPIVLGSVLILPACNKAGESPATTSESTPPAAMTKLSDADLEKAIRAKLESDNAIKQADLSVSVKVDDNKATLSGTVASQDLRNKAIDLAKSAQPGLIIEDKIDVKPAV
jgi:BON domain-containing protein